MTLEEILVILQHRLVNLNETRKMAALRGNLAEVNVLDDDINSTKLSIEQITVQINSVTPT